MLADKGEDRRAVSRRMPICAFMHLLVLGAFCPLPLGTASLRHFQGLERHRLRKHPAGPASSTLI